MPLTLLWLQLAASAGIILAAAHYMAGAADIIAGKTGLGRSFIGVVLLASATSLPELGTGVSAIALVVGSAVWLANIGEDLTHAIGWEASFVGTQFLALSTSLPEIAASFAALRLGAPEMAITNLLGSNLFNMGFVLFVDDLAFTQGVLWANIAEIHILTAIIAVVMTATVVTGILINRRYAFEMPVTVEAGAMITLYAAASALVFLSR